MSSGNENSEEKLLNEWNNNKKYFKKLSPYQINKITRIEGILTSLEKIINLETTNYLMPQEIQTLREEKNKTIEIDFDEEPIEFEISLIKTTGLIIRGEKIIGDYKRIELFNPLKIEEGIDQELLTDFGKATEKIDEYIQSLSLKNEKEEIVKIIDEGTKELDKIFENYKLVQVRIKPEEMNKILESKETQLECIDQYIENNYPEEKIKELLKFHVITNAEKEKIFLEENETLDEFVKRNIRFEESSQYFELSNQIISPEKNKKAKKYINWIKEFVAPIKLNEELIGIAYITTTKNWFSTEETKEYINNPNEVKAGIMLKQFSNEAIKPKETIETKIQTIILKPEIARYIQ